MAAQATMPKTCFRMKHFQQNPHNVSAKIATEGTDRQNEQLLRAFTQSMTKFLITVDSFFLKLKQFVSLLLCYEVYVISEG